MRNGELELNPHSVLLCLALCRRHILYRVLIFNELRVVYFHNFRAVTVTQAPHGREFCAVMLVMASLLYVWNTRVRFTSFGRSRVFSAGLYFTTRVVPR